MEIWKDIEGYEGLYQVSSLGRVKSLSRRDRLNRVIQEKILKPQLHRTGYLQVILCKEGKRRSYLVHRLVAETFIDNPEDKSQVNHKDEDKTNNKVENLEWMTARENTNYGTRNERSGKSQTNDKKRSKPIYGINIKTNERIEFPSTAEARRNGFDQGNIVHCLKGRCKSHKGYKWFYEEGVLKYEN